jgi:hypothetical protein
MLFITKDGKCISKLDTNTLNRLCRLAHSGKNRQLMSEMPMNYESAHEVFHYTNVRFDLEWVERRKPHPEFIHYITKRFKKFHLLHLCDRSLETIDISGWPKWQFAYIEPENFKHYSRKREIISGAMETHWRDRDDTPLLLMKHHGNHFVMTDSMCEMKIVDLQKFFTMIPYEYRFRCLGHLASYWHDRPQSDKRDVMIDWINQTKNSDIMYV